MMITSPLRYLKILKIKKPIKVVPKASFNAKPVSQKFSEQQFRVHRQPLSRNKISPEISVPKSKTTITEPKRYEKPGELPSLVPTQVFSEEVNRTDVVPNHCPGC